MYLIDTAIVAELRSAKGGGADPGLARWAAGVSRHSLFLSALSLLELQTAATDLVRRDRAGAEAMESWIADQLLTAFDGRILPVDVAVVRRRGKLGYADARDGLIAATALEHGLTLVTRNLAAFRGGRVRLFNPSGYTPDARTDVDDDSGDWRQASRARPLWLKNLFVR